jgi:hypothetical protein
MRQRCIPPPGSEQEKQLSFRPPDPAWAPVEAVQRARAALKRYDPFLDLWWSPVIRITDAVHPGRWTIKAWEQKGGAWDLVHIWEGPDGSFRNEFPVDALIEVVAYKDRWRTDATANETWAARIARMDRENQARDDAAELDKRAETWRWAVDKANYDQKTRFNVPMTDTQSRFEKRQARLRAKHRRK